ncbi:hypothetical protein [Streptomyces sp. ALI-76-A]|uniref:hypothetical protein n=1 Tax=Streptomyces sp. ALI-76-A TaxID=3025736 RepID=UPI00256F12DD|nr:hypothetical protein [Streptomyces sp. ALI-76-A]MDL5204591.1 hypothetical protein [Streptomyces sp. ALI-76-A]
MSSPEPGREPDSPLERETGERDVHPEEEGHPQPDPSGDSEVTDAREEWEETDQGTG